MIRGSVVGAALAVARVAIWLESAGRVLRPADSIAAIVASAALSPVWSPCEQWRSITTGHQRRR
jgi:hypothetical protein